ncbi:MAG: ABC transporter ATP-binding protein [Deltaproteobacteria bacterium]|nr:ABC transporter ATP-binding protein [Deltaproteobacteria bacterium]
MIYEVHNLSFNYGQDQVLKEISFDLKAGEVLGILGPNACGKSTLLKILTGLLKNPHGKIKAFGKDLTQWEAKALAQKQAYLPQNPSWDFPFSVLQFALLGRYPHQKNPLHDSQEDFNLAQTSLVRCGLKSKAHQKIQSLSGGEKQRLLLARALTQEPQALLLDEPLSHLDLKGQWQLLDLFKKLHQEEGLSSLVVLHDPHWALQACDRLLMIKAGKVFKEGPTKDLIVPELLSELYEVPLDLFKPQEKTLNIFSPHSF